jgi:hypothetical protein
VRGGYGQCYKTERVGNSSISKVALKVLRECPIEVTPAIQISQTVQPPAMLPSLPTLLVQRPSLPLLKPLRVEQACHPSTSWGRNSAKGVPTMRVVGMMSIILSDDEPRLPLTLAGVAVASRRH